MRLTLNNNLRHYQNYRIHNKIEEATTTYMQQDGQMLHVLKKPNTHKTFDVFMKP
jgi:hypothetical protein